MYQKPDQLVVHNKRAARTYDWLDDRLALTNASAFARKKVVPMHRHSIWYYFGGMTLFLFGVQVVTGILLLLYYRPSAENAFESIQFIMTEVEFGWLIRSIHSWSANLLIGTLFIHMFSVYFMRAYRSPREFTWVTGVLMLFIAIGFGFSGYLLPWNTLSFFATKVGTDIAGMVPFVGDSLLRFLRGGEDVTGATLTRFFGLHVAVLPALTTALLGVHLLLVQLHGMSVPPKYEGKKLRGMKFFPNFFMRDAIGWLLAVGVLAALAALFPWELGEKADPFAPAPEGIKPEWYILFMFETLKLIPSKVWLIDGEVLGVLFFSVGAVIWLLVPFLDRSRGKGLRNRIVTVFGMTVTTFIVIMTVIGFIS